jgi:hypothetical protein
MREFALIVPEPRTTTFCFELRAGRLLIAACTAARMSVPV